MTKLRDRASVIAGVPGVPETRITEALLARLPENLAPAPWECTCQALLWSHRGGRHARAALPPGLRHHRALGVVGGMVRYQETPVGRYDEVLGMVASHEGATPWGNVAFMSVDSEASLVGGRSNWAMPKALGAFEGDIGHKETFVAKSADGMRWRVSATARVIGPSVPINTTSLARQEFPDGVVRTSRLEAKGRLRPALIEVRVDSEGDLGRWLRTGRHVGAFVESMVFSLDAPRR